MNSSRALDARVHLVRANEQLIALSVSKVADRLATADLVVLLLDTRDPVARDLARAIIECSGDLDLDAEEARILAKPDVVPTGLAVIPLATVRAGFGISHRGIADGLRAVPSPGRVRVVVVATGGATLLHLALARNGGVRVSDARRGDRDSSARHDGHSRREIRGPSGGRPRTPNGWLLFRFSLRRSWEVGARRRPSVYRMFRSGRAGLRLREIATLRLLLRGHPYLLFADFLAAFFTEARFAGFLATFFVGARFADFLVAFFTGARFADRLATLFSTARFADFLAGFLATLPCFGAARFAP